MKMRICAAIWAFLLGLLILSGSTRALAESACTTNTGSEKQAALDQLTELKTQLAAIEDTVERYELGRLIVLKNQVNSVETAIRAKGLGHMATIREYQVLIVSFRYSTGYLNRVATGATQENISQMMKLLDQIVEQRGFDDSPYTQITLGTFSQIYKLLQDLLNQPIPEGLKSRLTDLIPPIGQVMAIAKQGDRPRTFAAATAVVLQIRTIYPAFLRVGSSDPGYETLLNLQGLTEFYAEVAQVEN